MRTALNRSAGRASWRLFQALFFIAALLAAAATFAAISGVSPVDPTGGRISWLLGANGVLIAILGWIVYRRYMDMQGAGRGSGHKLARRFLLLFSASAIIPAAIVAIFLGATMTRGLDNWFNERVDTLVTETAEVARQNVQTFADTLDQEMMAMAVDVNNAAEGLGDGSGLFETYLGGQAWARGFDMAYVIDGTGNVLSRADMVNGRAWAQGSISATGETDTPTPITEDTTAAPPFLLPSQEAFGEADASRTAQTLYERMGLATGLMPLDQIDNGYLYVYRAIDPRQLAQLRRAEEALVDYREAKTRSEGLQWLFAIGYAQLAALILLLSGRLGLEAAGRITGPIGRLAGAALAVRDGDLTVRVPAPADQDEIYDLTRSFNMMTEQLSEQRNALITAREEAEDRRQFVETLLAEVSAGVIRTDGNLQITLANRSAETLLGHTGIQGLALDEVAPDFAPFARDALERNAPVDASLDLRSDASSRHFRLKAALDPAGGCVLTFDDATRLVTAQRQLAWRDVARRIAHEIRNPLTPIQLSTERLKRRYGKDLGKDDNGVFDRCVETILRQVSDIQRMVEEFSTFARMPKPSVAEFDMAGLLHGASFSQGMVSPDVSIEFKRPQGKITYRGDERLLGQAIGNLLKNAAEAIEGLPEGNETAGQIEVSLTDHPGDRLEIVIEDNGPGFPEEARERLLEPYVTHREKGTGLGLAIVNRIIMDHGGAVTLQGRADGLRGARVSIVLPHTAPSDQPVLIEPALEETIA